MRFLENFPFGEGKGRGRVWGKKNCFVFSGPNGNCVSILKSISLKKLTHRYTDRDSIALRDVQISLKYEDVKIPTKK